MKSWFILSLSGSRSYSNRMIGPMNLFLVKWKSVNWKEKRRAKKTWTENANKQVIAPGAARRYARRRWQFDSRRIYVRSRTDLQSAHLWWRAVAKLQAASVPIAQSSCAMEQTEGRITVSRNAPPLYGEWHIITSAVEWSARPRVRLLLQQETDSMNSCCRVCLWYDSLRYDTRCYFNVRSKSDMSQLRA